MIRRPIERQAERKRPESGEAPLFRNPTALFRMLLAIGLPLTAFFASQQTPILLLLMLVAALATAKVGGLLRASSWRAGASIWIPAALVGFLGYAALSALWAPSAVDSVERAAKLAGVATLAMLGVTAAHGLRARAPHALARAAAFSLGLLLCLILLEVALGAFSRFAWVAATAVDQANAANRAMLCLAVLFWPLCALAAPSVRRWAIWPTLASTLVLAPFTGSLAGAVALAAGALVWAVAACSLSLGRAAVLAVAATGVLVPALIGFNPDLGRIVMVWALDHTLYSIAHRAGIWLSTAHFIDQHLWLGWGLDAARHVASDVTVGDLADLETVVTTAPRMLQSIAESEALPLHPHSWGLQITLELGLIGLIPVLAGLWILTRRTTSPHGLAALAGFITIASVSVGLWQTWWLCLGVIAVLLTTLVPVARATGPTA